MRFRHWLAVVAVSLVVLTVGFVLRADHGQCRRRCREVYGVRATGARGWLHRDTCGCALDGLSVGSLPRPNPRAPPADPGTRVCGADGATYATAGSAREHTTAVHAGACGACSGSADLAAYRRTAATLTGIAEQCATRNAILGEDAGRACLRERAGLSVACVECWVDNMSCTAVHCLGVCLRAKVRGEPRNLADGRLNDCLQCDEGFCGARFISCAGANRRRAGITSDIQRPEESVWHGGGM